MKYLILLVLFVLPFQWEQDFEKAKQTAKAEHKLILLNFSGSDWCAPCILLRRNYLDSEVFSNMAKDNLVLVNADFPRKKNNQLPKPLAERNESLAELYNKEGNFPLTLLLNGDGKVIKSWKGKPESSVEDWTSEINKICIANR